MECQNCHKRPASIHLTKIINGKKMEVHLCEQCAQDQDEIMGSGNFSIHHLLSGLLNFEQPSEQTGNTFGQAEELQCPTCGLTYRQFAKIGKFGCNDCYKTFDNRLDPLLRKVHSGNTTHTGKIPKRAGRDINVRKEIKALKENLKELIEKEEFEEAARVRDEIRALEKRGES